MVVVDGPARGQWVSATALSETEEMLGYGNTGFEKVGEEVDDFQGVKAAVPRQSALQGSSAVWLCWSMQMSVLSAKWQNID